ncbi:MAG: PAS domain S-box protein [Methanomassiliicoccales archaeon]|nr:MAG: PAS domain S-box protein [Methanomassiliicoccales archaeon]
MGLDKLDVHDHVAFYYEDHENMVTLLSRVLRLVSDRKEACVFLASEEKEQIVKGILDDTAVGQICIGMDGSAKVPHPYTGLERPPTAESMLAVLGDTIDLATDEGYNAVWVFTESEHLKRMMGQKEHISFESLSNKVFEEKRAVGVCMIDAYGGRSTIMNSIMTHPTLLIKGHVCRNHFYMDPEKCSRVDAGPPNMNFILDKLLEVQMSELEGRCSEEDLRVLNIKLQAEVERRKMVEWALLRSDNDHKTAINAIEEMLFVTDKHNKILVANDAFLSKLDSLGIYGNVIGEDINDVMPFIKGTTLDDLGEVVKTGRGSLKEGRIKFKGKELVFEVKRAPIMNGDEVGRVVSVIRDVTEQRRTKDELIRLREQLSNLMKGQAKEIISLREHITFEQERRILAEGRLLSLVRILERSKISMLVGDCDMRVIYANPAFYSIMGYQKEEMETIDLEDIFVPKERQMVEEIISEMGPRDEVEFLADAMTKDGSNLPCELNVIKIDRDGHVLIIMTASKREDAWSAPIGEV